MGVEVVYNVAYLYIFAGDVSDFNPTALYLISGSLATCSGSDV